MKDVIDMSQKPWNGEDILLSLVSRALTGKKPYCIIPKEADGELYQELNPSDGYGMSSFWGHHMFRVFFLRLAIQRLCCIFPKTIPFFGFTALNDYGWLKKHWTKKLLNQSKSQPLKLIDVLTNSNPHRYDTSKNSLMTSLPQYVIVSSSKNPNW